MANDSPFWTEAAIDELKTLNSQGYTGKDIGTKLGCSRNAVSGKLRRLHIAKSHPARYSGHKPSKLRLRPPKGRLMADPTPIPKPKPEPTAEEPDRTTWVMFVDLKPQQCRFPVDGTGYQMWCCGAQRLLDGPYCDYHHLKAHT